VKTDEVIMAENDVVVELCMTARQVQTLQWILLCWLGKYEGTEWSVYREDSQAIFDALRGVE